MGDRASSTRRRRRTRSPTPTSPISPDKPTADDATASRRRSPTSPRAPSRTTSVVVLLIGHGSFDGTQARVQPAGPRPDRRRLGEAARQAVGAARRVRQHRELERRVPAGARRAGPRRRHRDQDRRRAQRDAVPRVLRRGASATTPPTAIATATSRSREAFEYAKTKVVAGVPAEGAAADRARDARRRRRGPAGGDAVSRHRPRRRRARTCDTTDPALRALVERARRASSSRSPRCKLKKSVDGRRRSTTRRLEKLLTDLALKTKAIRDLQAKKDKP